MQLIKNNPYRILGLLVGAKATQLSRHVSRIPRYIDAGDEIPLEFTEFCFDSLGPISRTTEAISNAAANLQLNEDKMNAALFWFYIGNPITDEPALDSLKDGNQKEASEIWTKLIKTGIVTQKNNSAFQNLSTLYLFHAFKNKKVGKSFLEKGIYLKLQFLESNFINEFKEIATGITYKIEKKELQLLFLNQIKSEIDKSDDDLPEILMEILMKQDFLAKNDFLKSFIQKPTEQILEKIAQTQKKRKDQVSDAEIYGNELYEETEKNLALLGKILNTSSLQYQNIADKVAEEILQCGIDFFKIYKDVEYEYDPTDDVMELLELADSIAIGRIVKQRCEENIEGLQEWMDEKPERERQKLIAEDLKFITSKLERFQNLTDNIENAENLIDSCKSRLLNIKKVLGATDDFYLRISSAVVSNAQGMLVTTINELLEQKNNFTKTLILNTIISKSLDLTYKFGSFNMLPDVKKHYNENLSSLKSIARQLDISTLSPKERLQQELVNVEKGLNEIRNSVLLKTEIDNANQEMNRIKEWQFLRSESDKQRQISNQQERINQLRMRSEQEKETKIREQNRKIKDIKNQLNTIDY
jgi:hypothetical protein